MSIYGQIREAVANKRAVRVIVKGNSRDVCPHVIGRKNGREQVQTYQFAGYSSSDLAPGGEWRCIVVNDISDVTDIGDNWHTGPGHFRDQTCVDEVDLKVDY